MPPDRARPPDRQQIGRDAEAAAARFLEARQLTILARNYRCRRGELDLVAETPEGVVVIVEVRLRADARYGGAAASVGWHKQQRIQRAACHLLAHRPALTHRALRFDVIDMAPEGAGYRIEWIRHAFEATPR
jgi:putative endonuclease